MVKILFQIVHLMSKTKKITQQKDALDLWNSRFFREIQLIHSSLPLATLVVPTGK